MDWVVNKEKRPVPLNPPCWIQYIDHGPGKIGEWAVDKPKAKLIQKIFKDYLATNLGIWQLTHKMNEQGVAVITKRAKPDSKWHRITMTGC